MKFYLLLGLAGLSIFYNNHAGPVWRVLQDEQTVPLLRNGDFEEVRDGKPVGWRAAPNGFQLADHEGRAGSRAILCQNDSGQGWFGASQTLELNRTNTAPFILRGWSKALDVNGGSDNDYALYVDLTYMDGTPLWGQVARFRAGTHDWEERRLTLVPEKPVKTLTLHCLFRGHQGKVWFDDVRLEEASSAAGIVPFQGVAIEPAGIGAIDSAGPEGTVKSGDGLTLSSAGLDVSGLAVGQRSFADNPAAGFHVRDVAADSDFFSFKNGVCPELGLKLEANLAGASNCIAIHGRLADLTHRDRAATILFSVPVQAAGWNWGDDIRRTRPIDGTGEFGNFVSVPCGATGAQSLYPLAAIWDEQSGVGLGLDMGYPAVYRVGYHAGLNRLFIAFDFGLSDLTAAFPGGAEFGFVLFQFDPAAGFRGALQNYMDIFPDYFVVRSKEQGLWMPFTDVSRVAGWEDFGFRYHEGANNVPWDDQHGVLSFRYTEPMTWWMPMAKDVPRTLDRALQVRDQMADTGRPDQRRMAGISRLAAMSDETGAPALLFRDTPWANGAVWSLNPNPWLGTTPPLPSVAVTPSSSTPSVGAPSIAVTNAATVYWNKDVQERLYGPAARGRLDGEYLDSLEGYVTADLNFRRDHFRSSTVPLTFSNESRQLALFKGLAVYEFTRWLAEDVHRLDKLMFANGVPYRFTYLCPWLDVLGTETDWLQSGRYHPASLATMDLWRSMSGAKPYLLLMNTDYDAFTPDLVEKYFQRALFFGFWPGFFSHNAADHPYWQNPTWFERDRPLFKKYIPLIKRVAQAGWHPVSYAHCPNSNLLIERFGPTPDGSVYLTLFNDQSEPQEGSVEVDFQALGLPKQSPQTLLGPEFRAADAGQTIRLPPAQAALWELRR